MDHGSIERGVAFALDEGVRGATSVALPPLAEEAVQLAALWTELVSGSCKVVDMLFAPESCTVVVRREQPAASGRGATLNRRDVDILEQALLAGVRKSVAVDYCLCSSSIAEVLRRCFCFMGLSCWPSRIPLPLVLAAHAKHAQESELPVQRVLAQNQALPQQSITASRPDLDLVHELSAAEYGVTRLFVEGKSYVQIAERRRTSARTVANQLASAFHRLNVSGRAELLCLLSRRQLAEWQAGGHGPSSARSTLLVGAKAHPLARAAG
jgi:DNA-binding NarL/FixJ family response regulator